MGIADFFRSATTFNNAVPASPNGQPASGNTTNGQPAPNNQQPANPTSNGNHANTNTPNQPVNPLDAYTNMFNNANKAKPEAAPSFALDNETVSKVTNSLDFTKDVPAELMTKALAGDAQAMIQAMNHVARGAYQTTLQHQSKLTDIFIGNRLDHESKQLSSKVRGELTTSALAAAPNYTHPVVKAELNRIADMIQKEHPDATPQQVAESALQYLNQLNSALTPQSTKTSQEDKVFDWEAYIKDKKPKA